MSARRWILAPVMALVLLFGAALISDRAESTRSPQLENDIQYLPSAEFLRVASFGHEGVVADALWFRLIQYYGENRHGEHGLDFFSRLANTVVDVDPMFEEGYRFSALVLSQELGDPDAGIALLEKGIEIMPENWWLPFEAGFIEYVTRMDDAAAFAWFNEAAARPGAPEFPRRFAAFVGSRAGNLDVARVLWLTIAETTSNEHVREDAKQKAAELEAAIKGEAPVPEWAKRKRVINGRTAGDGA